MTTNAQSRLYAIPTEIGDRWTAGTPEEVGLNSNELSRAIDWLDDLSNTNVHSILVAHRGYSFLNTIGEARMSGGVIRCPMRCTARRQSTIYSLPPRA